MSSTLTTASPFTRGQVLGVGTGPDFELVKVRSCTGVGPFTVTIRRYRWHDHTWDTMRAYWRRLLKPFKDWRYVCCDTPWCPRAAVLETDDFDAYCRRHAPADAHEIEDDE